MQPLAAAAYGDEELVEIDLERGEDAVGPVLHLEPRLARLPASVVDDVLRFGEFELEPATRELRDANGPIHVEAQVFDVLLHLIEHRDRVVPKTELLDEIWGDRFVSESALTSRIKSARQAIGDSGEEQQAIRTVRGMGYVLEHR